MSKRANIALALTVVITAGVSLGGLWFYSKTRPGIIPGWQSTDTSTPADLTILGDTFSGYSTFRNGEFQQALKTAGVNLRYEDEFVQSDRAKKLTEGKADLIVTTLDQFLKQKPNGKIVGLIDRTIGADAVVLNTKKYANLKSLLDLEQLVKQWRSQGKQLSIAFAGDTPSEYLALLLDTKFDAFNLADFEIIRVADASEAYKLLQDPNKNVAIAVIWEPYVAQARLAGYTVVLSSQDAPNAIVDVLVASNRLIESQPQRLTNLLETYYRRIDSNVRNTSQLKAQIATDGKLSPNDASAVLSGIEFFTAVEAKRWMADETLGKRINTTAAVLSLAGQLDRVPSSPNELFTPQFLTKAADNTQILVDLIKADNPELAERLAGTRKAAPTQLSATQVKAAPNIGNLQVRGEVKFATGSNQLAAEGVQTLDRLAQEIGEFNVQTVAVRVIGHTSQTGPADFNQILSQQRAQVVVDYLRGRGLKHNIVPEGKGFSQPLPGISPVDERNQRTEIRLVRLN